MSQIVQAAGATGTQSSGREQTSSAGRVLLVDADPAALLAVNRALRRENYFVATAFSADGAIETAHQLGPFELLITPTRTASLDGIALARALRQFEPELQVLYVTNCTDELFAPSLPQTADDDVIERPFSQDELLDAVAALLYWHRRPRSTR